MKNEYYQMQLIERRIAQAVARQLASRLDAGQRSALLEADEKVRQAQTDLRQLTDEIVDEVTLGSNHQRIRRSSMIADESERLAGNF